MQRGRALWITADLTTKDVPRAIALTLLKMSDSAHKLTSGGGQNALLKRF